MRTEFEEQVAFVDYLELLRNQGKIQLYTALPNNTFTKSWKQKRKQTAEGVKPGFPDLAIVTNSNFVLIEMKKEKGGKLSPYQKQWIEALTNVGIKAYVARGFDEAKACLESNL